jgi:hypothetical protein
MGSCQNKYSRVHVPPGSISHLHQLLRLILHSRSSGAYTGFIIVRAEGQASIVTVTDLHNKLDPHRSTLLVLSRRSVRVYQCVHSAGPLLLTSRNLNLFRHLTEIHQPYSCTYIPSRISLPPKSFATPSRSCRLRRLFHFIYKRHPPRRTHPPLRHRDTCPLRLHPRGLVRRAAHRVYHCQQSMWRRYSGYITVMSTRHWKSS